MKRKTNPLVLALIGSALVGCGGSTDSPITTTSQPVGSPMSLSSALATQAVVVTTPAATASFKEPDGTVVQAGANELIFTLDPEISSAQLDNLGMLLSKAGGTLAGDIPDSLQLEVEFPAGSDLMALQQQFQSVSGVLDVSLDEVIATDQGPVPVNPTPANFEGNYWVNSINAPVGWGYLNPSAPFPLVAIADGGLNLSQGVVDPSRLAARVDSVGSPLPADSDVASQHGGNVLAFALGNAAPSSSVPTVGVNWGSRALVVKVLGPGPEGFSFNAFAGIANSLRARARVVNCSFGPTVQNPTSEADFYAVRSAWRAPYTALLELAAEHDAVICFSAGNDGAGGNSGFTAKRDDSFLPAGSRENAVVWSTHACIVGSNDASNAMSSFSREGAVVHLTAPGEGIGFARSQGKSDVGNGTSYASPLAAGSISALLNIKADLMACEARQVVLLTLSRNITSVSGQLRQLNFGAAAQAAVNLPGLDTASAITQRLSAGQAQALSVTLANPGNGPLDLALFPVGDAMSFCSVSPASFPSVPAGASRTFQVTLSRNVQPSGRELTFPFALWGSAGTNTVVRRLPVKVIAAADAP